MKKTSKSRKHRVPNRMDAKRATPKHIIITLPEIKEKERILKVSREKEKVTYKGVPIRLSAYFSKETLTQINDLEQRKK